MLHDPVHGLLTLSGPEKGLVASPFVQRLRRVTQLGVTSEVFPGATHTRFSHSLGTMYVAGLYAAHLFPGNSKMMTTCRVAGLLHDVGHGPFSHTWDRVVYSKIWPTAEKGHDEQRIHIVLEGSVGKLIEACGITVMDVVDAWRTDPLRSVLQGEMGADRLDYVRRDAHFVLGHEKSVELEVMGRDEMMAVIRDGRIDGDALVFGEETRDVRSRFLLLREEVLYGTVYSHAAVVKKDAVLAAILEKFMDECQLEKYSREMGLFKYLDENLLIGILLARFAKGHAEGSDDSVAASLFNEWLYGEM